MNALNLMTIELNDLQLGDEISIKVSEGILTMTVVDVEEHDVGGEDNFGNYHSATIYEAMGVKGVKLNGQKSDVYTDEAVNKLLDDGVWSVTYTEGHRQHQYDYDDCDRYGGRENY